MKKNLLKIIGLVGILTGISAGAGCRTYEFSMNVGDDWKEDFSQEKIQKMSNSGYRDIGIHTGFKKKQEYRSQ